MDECKCMHMYVEHNLPVALEVFYPLSHLRSLKLSISYRENKTHNL